MRRGSALAVLVVAVLGGCSCSGGGSGGARSRSNEAVIDVLFAPSDVLAALDVEATAAGLSILGQSDLVDLPVEGNTEARQRTDRALADLTAVVDSDEAAAPYEAALEAFGGLDRLRRDVDDPAFQPAGLANRQRADELFRRYTDIAAGVLDAQFAYALAIDQPDLRQGAQLYVHGLRQNEWERQLLSSVLLGAVDERMNTPGWIADVSSLVSSLEEGRESITSLAADSVYEDPVREVYAAVDEAGVVALASDALEQGTVDVTGVLGSVELQGSWSTFVDKVEEILRASA